MDTLSIARELRAADPPQAQAEAIASAIGRAVNAASLLTWGIGTCVAAGALIVANVKL